MAPHPAVRRRGLADRLGRGVLLHPRRVPVRPLPLHGAHPRPGAIRRGRAALRLAVVHVPRLRLVLSGSEGGPRRGRRSVGAHGVLHDDAGHRHRSPGRAGGDGRIDAGIALYYAVLVFNLAVTGWIDEWTLVAVGIGLHALMALVIVTVARRAPGRSLLRTRGAERV